MRSCHLTSQQAPAQVATSWGGTLQKRISWFLQGKMCVDFGFDGLLLCLTCANTCQWVHSNMPLGVIFVYVEICMNGVSLNEVRLTITMHQKKTQHQYASFVVSQPRVIKKYAEKSRHTEPEREILAVLGALGRHPRVDLDLLSQQSGKKTCKDLGLDWRAFHSWPMSFCPNPSGSDLKILTCLIFRKS